MKSPSMGISESFGDGDTPKSQQVTQPRPVFTWLFVACTVYHPPLHHDLINVHKCLLSSEPPQQID